MDRRDAINIANLYAIAVKTKYDYIKIILFGSYAKGNFNDDSDIDIAVILKDYKNLMDIQLDLMRIRRKIDSRIEPHPFRESEFEITNPIVSEILKYGQEIGHNVA
ncbi:MAG: nucleotidyltransferase domain-containing protein [Bacteroidales bacterium]|jgi:predicted nucleotidyltransferase|nr:nucleotidyltransferase domain-containing protein [Bacteroidales bacterium]